MYEDVIKELNAFLKGMYMGIHSYEHYIHNTSDFYLKKQLQNIQQEHKIHAMRIAERIQNLGGTPVDDEGIMGSIQEFFGKITAPETPDGIVRKALRGEDYYGIQYSREMVKGDLDEQSRQLVDEILHHNQRHVETLRNLLE